LIFFNFVPTHEPGSFKKYGSEFISEFIKYSKEEQEEGIYEFET